MMGAMSTSTYTVERSATIAAEPQRIYDRLVDFHEWMGWSPWEDLDPDQQRTFSGAESGTGAAYAWSGNRKAGKGTMRITGTQPPNRVDVDLLLREAVQVQQHIHLHADPDQRERDQGRLDDGRARRP